MRRLTPITRRDIFDMLIEQYNHEMEYYVYQPRNSYWNYDDSEAEKVFHFYGRIDVIEFLGRLYDLEKLPSYNDKKNAKEDILQHFVRNNDYSEHWLFFEDRFELKNGDDEKLLAFLSEMFDPYVRNEKSSWRTVLDDINNIIVNDGYELFEKSQISGRSVYGWKDISNKNLVIEKQAESLAEKFDSEYILKQLKYLDNTIETNPDEAIGKAKELLESCCKTILEHSCNA